MGFRGDGDSFLDYIIRWCSLSSRAKFYPWLGLRWKAHKGRLVGVGGEMTVRCGKEGRLVVDAFTGAGGNAVQLAARHRVVAVDIDEGRLRMAAHNAGVYGVHGCVDFICGDFFAVARMFQVAARLFASCRIWNSFCSVLS